MQGKLWFVTDGVSPVGVFTNGKEAERKFQLYQDDPDFGYYDYYAIEISELEDYPEEYDLASAKGLV